MRRIRRSAAAALIALTSVGVLAAPVSAHTGFESSDPADGSIASEPVDTITIVFSGDAEPTGDGFRVLEPDGRIREPDVAATDDGRTWELRFDPPLAGGAVGVRWMVKAPDAHPIDGSFSFEVTAEPVAEAAKASSPSEQAPTTPAAPEQVQSSTSEVDLAGFLDTTGDPTATARRVGAGARLVTLLGTLVGIGALIFAAAVLRGDGRDVRYVLHWVRRAGLLIVIGTCGELVAQIAVEGNGDWWAFSSPSTLGSVIGSSFGIAVALRAGGGFALVSGARLAITDASHTADPILAIRELVAVGAGPAQPARPADPPVGTDRGRTDGEPYLHHGDLTWTPTIDSAGAMLGTLALLAAHLFDGHTVTKGDRLWTGLAAMVHVAGAAVWAGGVLMLAAVLWRRHRQRRELRALQLAVRFSVVATLALVAVGAAGLALAIIVLDSASELWMTEWGRTLIAKTLLVGVAAAAGGYNHKVVIPQLDRTPQDIQLMRRFRVVVSCEALVLLAVVAVTALLMGAAS